LRQEGYDDADLEEFQQETFGTLVDDISIIKQAGGYSSVTFPGLFVLKDIWKFGYPGTSLEDFM
jgi:hypothetical protein